MNFPHVNRYTEILRILAKYGFDDLIADTGLDKIAKGKFRLRDKNLKKLNRAQRIRSALEELGPTFIKFGQILSNRDDILEKDIIYELHKLQDNVSPFSPIRALQIIKSELHSKYKYFKYINPSPLATASIAQVHQAVLLNEEEVVIKIKKPDIDKSIEIDTEIIINLAKIAKRYYKNIFFDLETVAYEFRKHILSEINFNNELSNIQQFSQNMHNDSQIYIPKTYPDLSTKNILTMEYIAGTTISRCKNDIQKEIGSKLLDNMLAQIFKYGFYHADPHPGNILVLKNKQICFLDFGMIGEIFAKEKDILADFLLGLVDKDAHRIRRAILLLNHSSKIINQEALLYSIEEMLNKYYHRSLNSIKMQEIFKEIVLITNTYHLHFPANIFMLLKTLISIDGTVRILNPEINIIESIKPFIRNIMLNKYNPTRIIKDSYLSSIEIIDFFNHIAPELEGIYRQFKNRNFSIQLEHKNMEQLLSKNDKISNRISFSIVLASLVIGSSLIILANTPPLWYGVSIIGLLGFTAAGIIGFWLLISVLKNNKM